MSDHGAETAASENTPETRTLTTDVTALTCSPEQEANDAFEDLVSSELKQKFCDTFPDNNDLLNTLETFYGEIRNNDTTLAINTLLTDSIKHKDKIQALQLWEQTQEFIHPASKEQMLLVPILSDDGQKIAIQRMSTTTYRPVSQFVPLSQNNLPETIPFQIDGHTYLLDTTTKEIKRTGIDSTDPPTGPESSIKEDLKKGAYGAAIKKITQKLYNLFLGKEENNKDIPLDEYYNLGPLLQEVTQLSDDEIKQRIETITTQIASTNDRQTLIRLTRILGILKDNLSENKDKSSLARLAQQVTIGDCLLINKNNQQVKGLSGRLGETLLELYEPGYAFTHIAMVTSTNPLEISHSTSKGIVTDSLNTYASNGSFEALVLQPQCDVSRKQAMATHAKNIVAQIGNNPKTYDTKSAALDAIGQSKINQLLDKGKKLNCGEFIAKVMLESGPAHAAALAGESIPNDFIDKVDQLFSPSYAATITN